MNEPIKGPASVMITIPDAKPCPECAGPQVFRVNVSGGGYSAGSDIWHEPTCSETRCKHGAPRTRLGTWPLGGRCSKCDEEHDAAHACEHGNNEESCRECADEWDAESSP